MNVLSLFSGAGGADLALEAAGFAVSALCEIEPHARNVLRYHWPDLTIHGDVCDLDGTAYRGRVDVVVGGSPCQDLSIAGKRKGLAEGSGTRSSLFHEQVRIWRETDAPYLIWENVKGAYSSNGGQDFAAVLAALVGATVDVPRGGWLRAGGSSGYVDGPSGVAAWRLLDLQHFGVPQRRERVVVLAARSGGVDPAEVLAVREGVSGYPAPRYAQREGAAAAAAGRAGVALAFNGQVSGADWMNPRTDRTDALHVGQVPMVMQPTGEVAGCLTQQYAEQSGQDDGMAIVQPFGFAENQRGELRTGQVAPQLTVGGGKPGQGYPAVVQPIAHTLRGEGSDASEDGTGRGTPLVVAVAHRGREGGANAELGEDGVAFALRAPGGGSSRAEVIAPTLIVGGRDRGAGDSHDNTPVVVQHIDASSLGVRMLTPRECERIMGWPDDWTRYGRREDGTIYELKDTPRYRLCGNGIGREWMEWIALRLKAAVEARSVAQAVA